MKTSFLLLAVLLLAGCTTAPKTKIVNIDSEPRGARVFVAYGVNRGNAKAKDYIGTTPFPWTIETDGRGGFKMPDAMVYSVFVAPAAVFTCEPDDTNLFIKTQVFRGGTIATPEDKIPSGIFFDLTKP